MPEITLGSRVVSVDRHTLLLDALIDAGMAVPHSCRSGSCHACLVRCHHGELDNLQPDALDAAQYQAGWRLACQSRVVGDVQITPFDPEHDGLSAHVTDLQWLSPQVLRLRVLPARRIRYAAGQYMQLWLGGVARPYSLTSQPSDGLTLEFHVDCSANGAFTRQARVLSVEDGITLGPVQGGGLHYDPQWQQAPLFMLGVGTGLAPLYAVLREALTQGHQGNIELWHVAAAGEHYLTSSLDGLAGSAPCRLQVSLLEPAQLPEALSQLRLVGRQTRALLCGPRVTLEATAKRLYLAGVPRNHILTDSFLPHALGE